MSLNQNYGSLVKDLNQIVVKNTFRGKKRRKGRNILLTSDTLLSKFNIMLSLMKVNTQELIVLENFVKYCRGSRLRA